MIRLLLGAAGLDAVGESLEDLLGLGPVDACIGDRDTVLELVGLALDKVLPALVQVGLNHHAKDLRFEGDGFQNFCTPRGFRSLKSNQSSAVWVWSSGILGAQGFMSGSLRKGTWQHDPQLNLNIHMYHVYTYMIHIHVYILRIYISLEGKRRKRRRGRGPTSWLPAASCSAMSFATRIWFSCFFWLLACEQSIMTLAGSLFLVTAGDSRGERCHDWVEDISRKRRG